MSSKVRDTRLATAGAQKIAWVRQYMRLLNQIEADFEASKPFSGVRIGLSIHLEAKTAYLAQVLHAGGAEVAVTGCNPLSTQDDVAAALADSGEIEVYAWHAASDSEYEGHLTEVLSHRPHLILDDGGDLVKLLHGPAAQYGEAMWGGSEETTTGVRRLRALDREGELAFPMIAVNDAQMKHLFDNRYGTGQSVWDGIMRTTNLTIAGRIVVVASYGWCGRGIAMRAHGLGANVVVTEVDPVRAIEALMDGFRVMPMAEAAAVGDIFVTATGCRDVIRREHMERMKDGAVLANAGHFDVEIDKRDLEALAEEQFEIRPNVLCYRLADGRRLNLLAEGRLVNLASGDGHPVEIMDLSFATQALTLAYLKEEHSRLEAHVYPVPEEIDRRVAEMRLASQSIAIDRLSEAQREYLEASV